MLQDLFLPRHLPAWVIFSRVLQLMSLIFLSVQSLGHISKEEERPENEERAGTKMIPGGREERTAEREQRKHQQERRTSERR